MLKEDCLGRSKNGRGEKERILRGTEDQTQHNKTHQTLFYRGGGGKGNENIMEGVNLFKVHSTHVWNYHNKIPSYYYCMLI
jgi:hypothetical protein